MLRAPLILAAALTLASPAFAEEPPVWSYARYVSESPITSYLGVIYGVPQTDDVRAYVECLIEGQGASVVFALAADVEGLEDGTEVVVEFTGPGFRTGHGGTVVRFEEGLWGVMLPFALDAEFWHWLRFEPEVTYGVEGRATLTLPISGLAEHLQAFLADCDNIRNLRPEPEPGTLPTKG